MGASSYQRVHTKWRLQCQKNMDQSVWDIGYWASDILTQTLDTATISGRTFGKESNELKVTKQCEAQLMRYLVVFADRCFRIFISELRYHTFVFRASFAELCGFVALWLSSLVALWLCGSQRKRNPTEPRHQAQPNHATKTQAILKVTGYLFLKVSINNYYYYYYGCNFYNNSRFQIFTQLQTSI